MRIYWVDRGPRWGVALIIGVTLVSLVLAGCGQSVGSHTHPTSSARPLSWQMGNVPPAIADQFALTDWHELPLAPSDENTLYGCALSQQAGATRAAQASLVPQIWVTHDRAVHWEQAGTIPFARPDLRLCYLTVDMLNPATVIAVIAWPPAGNHPAPGQSASFVSLTGGQTWLPLSYTWSAQIAHLATTNGTTYALVDSNDPAAPHLVASTDGLQNWHSVDQAISAVGQKVWLFVVNPGTRTILAQVGKDGVPVRQLWSSTDGGVTWISEPVPTAEQYVFAAGASAPPESLCAGSYDASQPAHATNHLYCSADGGARWSERPGLNIPASIAVGPASASEFGPSEIVGVTPDGAVLALNDGSSTPQIYRLPAGGTQWQQIGVLPLAARMVVFYHQRSGSGVLWALNIASDSATPEVQLFTTTYP